MAVDTKLDIPLRLRETNRLVLTQLSVLRVSVVLSFPSPRRSHPTMNASQEVRFGDQLRLRLPADISASSDEQSIDSNATVWRGSGVTVLVDEGPFADTLTSYRDRPNHRVTDATINGHPARVVSFERKDGGHYVAAHFAGAEEGGGAGGLTVAVETIEGVSPEIGSSILRSIAFP